MLEFQFMEEFMVVNHNLGAMNANRVLSNNNVNQDKSMEKLASGLKINRAGDDSAGLAVSEGMRAQIKGLNQASQNSLDAISFVQTAEGSLNETHGVLQRMNVLATQSANGTYTDKQRELIQVEVEQLTDEINRISEQTHFNGHHMLRAPKSDSEGAKSAEDLAVVPAKINVPAQLEGSAVSHTLRVHVGANKDEAVAVNFFAADAANLLGSAAAQGEASGNGKSPIQLTDAVSANNALETIQAAIDKVSAQRANIGSFQNRLESAIRSTDTAAENTQAAESRIRDTDMAKTVVENTKNNILGQASQAMLGQANTRTQGVLQLLN